MNLILRLTGIELSEDNLIRKLCELKGIKEKELFSAKRTQDISSVRFAAYYILTEVFDYSLTHAANKLRRKNHTSVLIGKRNLMNYAKERMIVLPEKSDFIVFMNYNIPKGNSLDYEESLDLVDKVTEWNPQIIESNSFVEFNGRVVNESGEEIDIRLYRENDGSYGLSGFYQGVTISNWNSKEVEPSNKIQVTYESIRKRLNQPEVERLELLVEEGKKVARNILRND